MFGELLERTRASIESVRSVLKTNEQMRTLLFAKEAGAQGDLQTALIAHIGQPPDPTLWRIHDHCAAITRLYGIYERFVVEIVGDWLAVLPKLVPNYQALDAKVHREHRQGVARVLQNLGSTKFRHLTPLDAVRGFYQAVSGEAAYDLLPEAFALREHNYRQEILQEIFSSVTVEDSWSWIQRYGQIATYIDKAGSDTTKAENELKQFVQYRNDAAHGIADEVLAVSRIIEISEFVEALCSAISELFCRRFLSYKEGDGTATNLGEVTEKFTNGAVVVKIQNAEVGCGDTLYACGETCCYPVIVKSIMLDDVAQERVTVTTEREVGLMFDRIVKKHRRLYRAGGPT